MKNNISPLTLTNVSFKFNKHAPYFFKNICLTLTPGNHYFVCGKNGVGKSTFFRILQGQTDREEQCTGTITPQGNVRLVAQDVNTMLADKLTVQENLQCALLPSYPTLQKLPETTMSNMLRECGISSDQPVASLSGGQRQMLAISMALQKPTQILLLDEPTAALDSKNARIVMEFIKKIAQEQSLVVLIISHDTELIAEYTHRNGNIVITERNGERTISLQ